MRSLVIKCTAGANEPDVEWREKLSMFGERGRQRVTALDTRANLLKRGANAA